MKVKSFLLILTTLIVLTLGIQQPIFGTEKTNSNLSSCHQKKKNCKKKVLCTSDTKNKKKPEQFKHNIQLQLSDALGFPVLGTEFWVTIDVIKDGPLVTLQLPTINFQTGQVSSNNPYYPTGEITVGIPPVGGYIYTSASFLPEELRPNDAIPRSIIAASNNGLSEAFSFTQNPSTLPTPPAGYIVQVTNAGELQIACAGTFGNIIPAGPQIMMPCTIQYIVNKKQKLRRNARISTGATNVTQFSVPNSGTGLRDAHLNDAYDGQVVWAWTDNSMIADQYNGTLNVMVAVGRVDKNGKLKIGTPVQLSDLSPGIYAWDTAVAIVRDGPNKGNIVVSYSVLNAPGTPCRAVSIDRGKTWPTVYDGVTPQPNNSPINIQPT